MDVWQSLPLAAKLALGALGLVWLVVFLLVPFMVESLRSSARKMRIELEEMNRKLDLLTTLLADRSGAAPQGTHHGAETRREPWLDPPAGREPSRAGSERARREPTISG